MALELFKTAAVKAIEEEIQKTSMITSIKNFFIGKKEEKKEPIIIEHPDLDQMLVALDNIIYYGKKQKEFFMNVNVYDATDEKINTHIMYDMKTEEYSEKLKEISEDKGEESRIVTMSTMDLYALDYIFNTVYVGNYIYTDQYIIEEKYIQNKLFRFFKVGKHKFMQPKEVFFTFIDTKFIVEAIKVLIYRKDYIKVIDVNTHKKVNILCTKRGILHILQFISKNHDTREPELQKSIKQVLECSKELVYKTSNV